jgi:hypothetical protein
MASVAGFEYAANADWLCDRRKGELKTGTDRTDDCISDQTQWRRSTR